MIGSKVINAILSLNPDAEVGVGEDDIKDIEWLNNTTPISTVKIQTEMDRLDAEYDAQEYARNRATEYPAIADQLDEIYHNGIDSWKAVIKVTKDKYPKG